MRAPSQLETRNSAVLLVSRSDDISPEITPDEAPPQTPSQSEAPPVAEETPASSPTEGGPIHLDMKDLKD